MAASAVFGVEDSALVKDLPKVVIRQQIREGQ
jgi:hypothetical protein